jgi:hypothetical protein
VVQHFRHPGAAADVRLQVAPAQAALLNRKLNCANRIGRLDCVVLQAAGRRLADAV